MGKSASKLEVKKETVAADSDHNNGGATAGDVNGKDENVTKEPSTLLDTDGHTVDDLEPIHELSDARCVVRERTRPSKATANHSIRGKRTSFYETVDASEILPNLLIGNLASAKNSSFLERKNVGFVLNLTNDQMVDEPVEGIEYKTVPMEDDEDEQLVTHLDECFEFMSKANVDSKGSPKNKAQQRKQDTKPSKAVLVHSYFGMSRSAAVILAYLMKEKGQTLREAYDHLKQCHTTTNPNDNFIVQLLRLEQELHDGKMTMTLKDFYH